MSTNGSRRVLRRTRDGVSLGRVEAETLLSARGDDLIDLCASAPRVRDSGLAVAERPAVLSYSHTVFIPLTRLCRDRCHLLHVRDHTPSGDAAVPVPGRGARHRRAGRGHGLQGSAVHPRRPARGPMAPQNADAVDADHPAGSAGTPERPSQQLPRAVPSIYAAFHQEDDR